LCTVYVGDLALLIDTSHPMIRPGLEKGIDAARKIMQTGRGFCLQVDTCTARKLLQHYRCLRVTKIFIYVVVVRQSIHGLVICDPTLSCLLDDLMMLWWLRQIDFSASIDAWLKVNYPRGCYTFGQVRRHRASLYITNRTKPQHCLDCNALWCLVLGPCWLLSAPCYKVSHILSYSVGCCESDESARLDNDGRVLTAASSAT